LKHRLEIELENINWQYKEKVSASKDKKEKKMINAFIECLKTIDLESEDV